jgi:hypothetical protein
LVGLGLVDGWSAILSSSGLAGLLLLFLLLLFVPEGLTSTGIDRGGGLLGGGRSHGLLVLVPELVGLFLVDDRGVTLDVTAGTVLVGLLLSLEMGGLELTETAVGVVNTLLLGTSVVVGAAGSEELLLDGGFIEVIFRASVLLDVDRDTKGLADVVEVNGVVTRHTLQHTIDTFTEPRDVDTLGLVLDGLTPKGELDLTFVELLDQLIKSTSLLLQLQ